MKKIISSLFIFCSIAANAQWTPISTFYSYYYFSSDVIGTDTIFVAGFDNSNSAGRIVNTLDGATWSDQTLPGSTPQIWAVKFPNKNNGFAAGQNGTIIKTTNLGVNWFNLSSGTTQQLVGLWFLDKDSGYVCGSNGTLLKTTNGGLSWNPLTTNTTMIIHSVCFPTAKIGYAVAYGNPLASGIILKSTDYGNTWATQSSPLFGSLNIRGQKVLFMNKDTGFVSGLAGAMLKTYDGGGTWTKIGVGQTSYNVNNISITPTGNIIFCGGQGTILKSTDYGNTVSDGGTVSTTIDYETVNMVSDTLGYMFGTNGGALKTTTIFQGIEGISAPPGLTKVFPNPIENSLNLTSEKNISEIKILSVEGKIIFSEKFPAKILKTEIDLSQFKSGIYFLEINYGGKVERRKLVKA